MRRNGSSKVRYAIVAIIIVIVASSVLAVYYKAPQNSQTSSSTFSLSSQQTSSTGPSTSASSTSTSSTTSSSSSSNETTTTNPNAPKLSVGTAEFSGPQMSLIGEFMDGVAHQDVTNSDSLSVQYDSLLNPSNVVDPQALDFTFQLAKNSYMNPEMYSTYPETNSTYLIYPVHVEAGLQGPFLIFNFEVDNLYGSPYGNATNRGNNILLLYMHIGDSFYGFGEDSDMLPGAFGSQDWARYTTGAPQISSTDGQQIYGYTNFVLPNQTYYLGPINAEYPYGNYSYAATTSFHSTGVFWAASEIVGNSTQPALTRYLFVLNTTALYPSGISNLGQILFSLETNNPFPPLIHNGQDANFMTLIDNYPSHLITAPFAPDTFMQLHQQSSNDSSSAGTILRIGQKVRCEPSQYITSHTKCLMR